MTNLRKFRLAFRRLLDRIVMWFWSRFHPCRYGWKEYDHDWEYVDDSFSHEFGTEICGHWECKRCGDLGDEDREPPSDGWDDYYDEFGYPD